MTALQSTVELSDTLGRIEPVAVALLRPGDSPRTGGVVAEHVQSLVPVRAGLPPIVVDRATLRVIDGMHRLRAAILRGDRTIKVRFFFGSAFDSFVLSVRANAEHGLPLSLADRSAAAARIVSWRPEWSDRAIASATGLASGTVAAIRARASKATVNARVGLDGKVRPLSGAEGRRAACLFVAENPDASLRAIAKAAGISVSTARDVRERLRRGEDPLPPKQRAAESPATSGPPGLATRPPIDLRSVLEALRNDPSLRYRLDGRMLLRLLDMHAIGADDWQRLADMVPAHCADLVSDAARECEGAWRQFANRVERRRLGRV